MDIDTEDVWYSWLGSSYASIRFMKSTTKNERPDSKGKKTISKVEEHINNLTKSLSDTQAALETAGRAEKTAREQHAGCAELLSKQKDENSRMEQEIKKLFGEIEESRLKRQNQTEVHERLKERIHELVAKVKQSEKEADEARYYMDNERLIHLQEREALRAVHTAHEECLSSLREAQDSLAAYQEDVALKEGVIQNLKRHKSRISKKLGYFSASLRRASKDLEDARQQLAEVLGQLGQAELIIQQHFTMLSSLETYKQCLVEELARLRSNYEDRTAQLARMKETLLERDNEVTELQEKLNERDTQLRDTESRALATQEELASTIAELEIANTATASAEQDLNEVRELNTEKDREITELDRERTELKNALKTAQQENSTLISSLYACKVEALAKDEKLAEEIAAHARASSAAEAQKLRLQQSIENLKSNLEKANGDLKKTRETLFVLSEKCHNFARAQMSLASYQKRTKMLLESENVHINNLMNNNNEMKHVRVNDKIHQRHDSGAYLEDRPTHKPVQTSNNDDDDDNEDPVSPFALDVRARHQQIVSRLQKRAIQAQDPILESRGPESIFEPLNPEGSSHKFPQSRRSSTCTTIIMFERQECEQRESQQQMPIAGQEEEGQNVLAPRSPTTSESSTSTNATSTANNSTTTLSISNSVSNNKRRVRFANIADEGYQTDDNEDFENTIEDDKAATCEAQMWDIIGNLERKQRGAKRDLKTIKRRQRQRNLKGAEGGAAAAPMVTVEEVLPSPLSPLSASPFTMTE